jgi:SET domain-containing protein
MINKVVVKRGSAGLGLFANTDFKKGELVIEYVGEKITDAEAQRRGGLYLFELNNDWTIDGKARSNIARYINHSCIPNCYPELDENEERIFIYAKRSIKSGEELTYNYGKYYYDTIMGPEKCRCPRCTSKRLK